MTELDPTTQPGRDDAVVTEQLEGRHAITEALRANRSLDKLYFAKGADGLRQLLELARSAGVVTVERDRAQLDLMSQTKRHQGVIATVAARRYAEVDELLAAAAASGRPPLLVVCDGVEDGRNLGAICRTAEAAGAHGIIIPKRRSASLSAWTDRAAAGALAFLPVARVSNLTATLKELKDKGLWVYGADAGGDSDVFATDLSGPTVLVLGSEQDGLSRLVREQCDFILSIPMYGQINSLNVSAAAAVLLYAAVNSRNKKQGGAV